MSALPRRVANAHTGGPANMHINQPLRRSPRDLDGYHITPRWYPSEAVTEWRLAVIFTFVNILTTNSSSSYVARSARTSEELHAFNSK